MKHHVFMYYMNMMNLVDGCPMTDYCQQDVYLCLAMRNM